MKHLRYTWLFVAVILWSCDNPSQPASGMNDLIQHAGDGDFRGVQIGDEWIEVAAREEQNVVYSMPDELICRVPLDMKDSTFYEISYNFNEGELYNIELGFFPSDSTQVSELYQLFKAFYDEKYGSTSESNGYTAWYTTSSQGLDLEISMANESREKGRPYLTVNFFEKDGIAP